MVENALEFMKKYEILVNFTSPIITAIIAVLNIIFVVLVFKLNSRLSQSKLSVLPLKTLYHNYVSLQNREDMYLVHLSEGSSNEKYKNKLPLLSDHEKVIGITLKNVGSLASSNIKITYTLKFYGTKFNYGTGLSSFDDLRREQRRVLLFSKKKHVKFAYMGADEEKTIGLIAIKGEYREIEVILNKIQANRFVYFKEKLRDRLFSRVIMSEYSHPSLKKPDDMPTKEYLTNLGADPIKFMNIEKSGVLTWVRNWFAEWRK